MINRKLRPTKSTCKLRRNKLVFCLNTLKKNLEEYKKAIEIKDKQLSEITKYSKRPKKSYDSVVK